MATTYKVDTNTDRLTSIEEKAAADIKESNASYDKMITDTKSKYNDAMSNWDTWLDTQTDLQNKKTEQNIAEIEQQKADLKSDYIKEQSGAYVDWQQQSNKYGVNAEKAAANGLTNSGFTANMENSLYNTYQNRVAAARETYNRSLVNYNNNINQAKLNNDIVLAEIAAEAAQNQMELSLQMLTATNNLLTQKADAKLKIQSNWQSVYQNMMNTIMDEYQLTESARQADMENKRAQDQIKIAQDELKIKQEQWKQEKEALEDAKIAKTGSSGGSSYSRSSYDKKLANDETKITKKTKTTSSGTAVSKKTTSSDMVSPKYEVDTKSVLALGFGPISPSALDRYVKNGIVEEYVSDGKLKYRKTAATLKQGMLYSKLG